MTHYTKTKLSALVVAVAALALAAGCGSPQKTGKKQMSDMAADAPPPPTGGAKPIDRKVSREAKKDFAEAYAFYQEQAKTGWTSASCTSAAERFISVAGDHDKLVEARFNAGLSYQNCGMLKEAEEQFQRALKISPNHAPSLTGLGEIYFRGGNDKRGVEYWEKAVKADPKTTAARNNLAWVLIGQLRNTRDSSTFARLEESARRHLSSVLAVDNDNIEAYVLYSLLYMEGADKNKSRLDLANLLLDEGAKRSDSYPPLYNARGLLQMKRANVGVALGMFEKAVELDPKFIEARMNVGNIVLGFRKYDYARDQFQAVLQMQPKNYEAMIGLGIAHRGLKDLDAAEDTYKKAIELDGQRGLAYFNLGLLYKDFRSNASTDVKVTVEHYKTAKKYFQQFLSKKDADGDVKKDAQDHIEDCDKYISQLSQFMNQPAGSTP